MAIEPTPQPEYTPASQPTPVTPSSLPVATPGEVPLVNATDTGLAPNVAAGLSVVLGLVTGIVFLLIEKRNRFVRFWAMQAVFFGGTALVFSIVSNIIGTVLGHILGLLAVLWGLFALVVSLGFLIVWIIMLVKAFGGQEWEIPILGKLARQQLDKPPTI